MQKLVLERVGFVARKDRKDPIRAVEQLNLAQKHSDAKLPKSFCKRKEKVFSCFVLVSVRLVCSKTGGGSYPFTLIVVM